jgi:hypothetical protein
MTTQSGLDIGWTHVLSMAWTNASVDNWVSQIALGAQAGDGAYYRTTSGSINGLAWKRLLDNSNYSSYALPVTGGSISGILNFGAMNATPYASPTGTSNGISFGGYESSSLRAYGIFTELENVGGNYSKLTFNYHTGIRLGASTLYGGIRFYNNFVGSGSEIFSVGNGDNNVRVTNSLFASAFFESSDATIKTLITDNYQAKGIESVVAKLYVKNGKEELGYYAQDVQDILPSAISKEADGLLNLSYREVHTAKIARLEKELEELKSQLARL